MGEPSESVHVVELARDDVGEVKGAIGRRVRLARQAAGIRAFDLAVAIGRLVHTVYRWEGGHVDPSIRDCKVIVRVTGCRYAWLLTGEGEMRDAA